MAYCHSFFHVFCLPLPSTIFTIFLGDPYHNFKARGCHQHLSGPMGKTRPPNMLHSQWNPTIWVSSDMTVFCFQLSKNVTMCKNIGKRQFVVMLRIPNAALYSCKMPENPAGMGQLLLMQHTSNNDMNLYGLCSRMHTSLFACSFCSRSCKPMASFQQNLGGRPDRRPFLSTLEPSPTPGNTGTELSAVAVDSRPTFISNIHLASL